MDAIILINYRMRRIGNEINKMHKKSNIFCEEKVLFGENGLAVSSLLQEVQKFNGSSHTLTIIDPYFLTNGQMDIEKYIEICTRILSCFEGDLIQIYTGETIIPYIKKEISHKVKRKIDFFKSKKIHDRLWITNDRRGFVVGASLNGIGNKVSLLYEISAEDMTILVEELGKIGIVIDP